MNRIAAVLSGTLCVVALGADCARHVPLTEGRPWVAAIGQQEAVVQWRCLQASFADPSCGTRTKLGAPPAAADLAFASSRALDVPAPPQTLVASISGFAVSLTWDASGQTVSSFVIEVGSAPAASNLLQLDTGSSATAFAGQAAPGTYYVRVRGRNVEGLGPPSNEVVVVVGGSSGCSPTLSAPGALTVVTASEGRLTLSWTGVAAALSYVLEAGSTPGSANLAMADVGAGTTFTASAVPDGAYFLRVRARGACGLSAPSNEVSLTMGGTLSTEMRAMIDGFLFSSGPYSDSGRTLDTMLGMWPDGVQLQVRISAELSAAARQVAIDFVNRYTAITNGAVRAVIDITTDPMHMVDISAVPANTLLLRVVPGFCPATVACNTGGPPLGGHPGNSISTFHMTNPSPYLVAHELGHGFGMWHVNLPVGSPHPLPLMAGARSGGTRRPIEGVLTDLEVRAILAVRGAGLRGGSWRSQAIKLGLIDPP